MGRVRANITIAGHNYWALFDSGARNTYIVEMLTADLPTFTLEKSEPVALGGRIHQEVKRCLLTCQVENLPIWTHARVLEEIGTDELGKKIEVLIGALTMQEWGIRLVLDEERLDLTHYPREFVEF